MPSKEMQATRQSRGLTFDVRPAKLMFMIAPFAMTKAARRQLLAHCHDASSDYEPSLVWSLQTQAFFKGVLVQEHGPEFILGFYHKGHCPPDSFFELAPNRHLSVMPSTLEQLAGKTLSVVSRRLVAVEAVPGLTTPSSGRLAAWHRFLSLFRRR